VRIHVVSDVHGNADALARAGDGADALIVLGDLLDFVDYHDHSAGILGRIFGAEKVSVFANLRRDRKHGEAAAYARSLWAELTDPTAVMEHAIREQYAEMFAAMTAPTYAMPGNVDVPALWSEYASERVHVVDGEVAEIGGAKFGFVGGALAPRDAVVRRNGRWFPYLRAEDDYDAAVDGLPDVDVLCSHIPPAAAELCYDVLARRFELGSAALLRAIGRWSPRLSLFGHVHQPLASRMRIGRTECVNVGHFQRTGTPYVFHI
jgi:Icc-related predicted phosphoesterase